MALLLQNPACDIGCAECTMRCAILPSRLAWWQAEIERAHAAGEERALRCAVAAHTALTQRWAESPRASQRRTGRLN